MPNDVKAIVSLVTVLVAFAFAHYSANYGGKPHLYWLVIGFGLLAVVAMWVFPEAGVKKGDLPKKRE